MKTFSVQLYGHDQITETRPEYINWKFLFEVTKLESLQEAQQFVNMTTGAPAIFLLHMEDADIVDLAESQIEAGQYYIQSATISLEDEQGKKIAEWEVY